MAFKRYNTLIIDYRSKSLPSNWRVRVEQAVKSVGASFDLNISSAKAGARKDPPGVLISLARDGSEEAWTAKCEAAMKKQVLAVLEHAKEEEIARQIEAMGLDAGPGSGSEHSIRAKEKRRAGTAEQKIEHSALRRALTTELAAAYRKEKLPGEAVDLVAVAIKRMQDPKLWALWAQVLLVVQETRKALPEELEQRLRTLLK
jgi:hypothetical protein